MARSWFGGTTADQTVIIGPGGAVLARPKTCTFWDAQEGGTQYTDLLLNGEGVTTITSAADGFFHTRFQGPDDVTEMWVEGGSGTRFLMTTPGAPGPMGPAGGGNYFEVDQVTDNVIPARDATGATTSHKVGFNCWNDPAAHVLDGDKWTVVPKP